ncbi:MAG TPA: hypothetical protein VKD69_03540 [Vicinamibacterales bacterium]|nr:hypothetical protein [Vicinamibacterales bacterium]
MTTTMVNLRLDAIAEARRLTSIRALAAEAGRTWQPFNGNGPWIARARTARRRQALRGRMLFIWQVGCEDASGRTASTEIVPFLVRLEMPPRLAARRSLRDIVDRIDSRVPDAIDALLRVRQRGLVEACDARAQMRLARERAIAAHVSQSARRSAPCQAGLFDRRSEREHRMSQARGAEAVDAAQGRIVAAAAAATVSPSQPHLLLVLVS